MPFAGDGLLRSCDLSDSVLRLELVMGKPLGRIREFLAPCGHLLMHELLQQALFVVMRPLVVHLSVPLVVKIVAPHYAHARNEAVMIVASHAHAHYEATRTVASHAHACYEAVKTVASQAPA